MIERVLVLNLESAPERRQACYTANIVCGVPHDTVYFWRAIPGMSFPNVGALIAEARSEFPEFGKNILDKYYGYTARYDLCTTAQAWSYLQMLQDIVATKKNTVILYDDRYIKNFGYLGEVTSNLSSHCHAPAEILQLEHYTHRLADPNKYMNPEPHNWYPWIFRGPMGGSENAMYFTPKGAEFLLTFILENHFKEHLNTARNTIETTIITLNEDDKGYKHYYTLDLPLIGVLEHLGTTIHSEISGIAPKRGLHFINESH